MQEKTAQNTFTLGESRTYSIVAWGFSVPHMRTLWRFNLPHTRMVASSLKTSFSANPSSRGRCWKSKHKRQRRLWSWGFRAYKSCIRYPFTRRRLRRMRQTLDWDICNSRLVRVVDFWGLLTNVSRTRSNSLSRCAWKACSFRSAQAAALLEFHVPFTNCVVYGWFCVVHDPKPALQRHNWLSFGKFPDTEHFLIYYERHFTSRIPPSGGTCKYAKAPSIKKLGEILCLLISSFLPCLSSLFRSRVRKFRRDLWISQYMIWYSMVYDMW